MAAQRVFHWKHGWIPLDHYAAVESAHGRDNTLQRLNTRISAGDAVNRHAAEVRAAQLGELLPAGLKPTPHRQFAVKNFSIAGTIPAHHTGGVVFNRLQARELVRHVAEINEGPIDPVDQGEISGSRPRRDVGVGSHGTHAEAKANARAITNLLGMEFSALPEYVEGAAPGAGHHTGGLVFSAAETDELTKRLQALHTGTSTTFDAQRAAGLSAPGAANPVGKDFRSMTSAEKIKAAEIMYGTGSTQYQAAKKKFGGK